MKLKLLACISLIALMAGCTTVQQPGPTEKPTLTTTAPVQVTADDPEQLMQASEYAKAAPLFVQRAEQSSGNEKTHYQLRAITALTRSDQLTAARKIMEQTKVSETDYFGQELLRLAHAHLALIDRRPTQVQSLLANKLREGIPANYVSEYHLLKAEAFELLGNRLEAARELVARETTLSNNALKAANQQKIWALLTSMSERALQQLRTAPPPDVLSGWMELVSIAKVHQLSPIRLKEQLNIWKQKYPNHPIIAEMFDALMQRKPEDVAYPDHIALLLPLTGKFAKAGEAVRDGFLAAYYARHANAKQSIRIYDSGDDVSKFNDLYQTAINDGAQFVVGPLQKEALQELLKRDDFPVPTLSLNSLSDDDRTTRANLYQFGLSPEEEARQVADRTWLDGYVHACVLVPSGPWGERMLQSFQDRWKAVGGSILEVQTYDPTKTDYSDAIQALLNIDESYKRYRKVAGTIRRDVKFTPRRRQDVDFIFLAAYPVQGRQIQPQLNFHHASDVPVYATSHVFTGTVNQERDRDMDGIRFGDMPWVLSTGALHRDLRLELEPNISDAGITFPRVYALGVDAFDVIGALHTLRNYPYERFDGETGSLSLDNNLHIRRQLTWVKFRAGRPIAIEPGNL